MKRALVFWFFIGSVVCADTCSWVQTDWKGGEGQLWWSDSHGYWDAEQLYLIGKDSISLSLSLRGWSHLSNLPHASKVYSILESPTPNVLYATSDSGGELFKSTNAGSSWILLESDPYGHPHTYCSMIFAGFVYAGGIHLNGGVIMRTSNDGGSWDEKIFSGINAIICLVSTSDNKVLAGGGGPVARVYKGDIGSWTSTSFSQDVKAFSLKRDFNNNIYIGTGDNEGLIFKSSDNGDTWSDTIDLPNATSVYCIAQAPDSALYAGTGPNGIIYKSMDGINWDTTATISGGVNVRSLMCDSMGHTFAGVHCNDGSARVFVSPDGGGSWINTGVLEGASTLYSFSPAHRLVGTDDGASIFKWRGFDTSGFLTSSIYNTGTGNRSVKYDTIWWDADSNGQDITVKVRSFQDTVTWSDTIPWSDCPPCTNGQYLPSLSSVRDSMQFIQYRLEFATLNPFISPVFHEIRIDYSLDTTGPIIDSAVAYGMMPNDKVLISFSEPIDTFTINSSNIDSLLKLSGGHFWGDSLGQISGASWDSSCKMLSITLGDSRWSNWVNVGDTIFPSVYQNDIIADQWGNKCVSPCVIKGSFGPMIDSIIASDGMDSLEYIDNDDYVTFYFSKPTNKPLIDTSNIDSVLRVPGKTWLDGLGELREDSCTWSSDARTLTCSLKVDSLRPTIGVGDTVWADSITIWDEFNRGAVVSPCGISGTFGEYGPIMVSAVAYEGWPPDSGVVGDGDWVWIYFNKLVDTVAWHPESLDIDTVLIPCYGDTHTWHPESLACYAQQFEQEDAQGIPYTVLYISFMDTTPAVEEEELRTTNYEIRNYPNPFLKGAWIEFQLKSQNSKLKAQGSKGTSWLSNNKQPAIAVGDTIYPNPNVIMDLEGRGGRGSVVLQGEFKFKSMAGTLSSPTPTLLRKNFIPRLSTLSPREIEDQKKGVRVEERSHKPQDTRLRTHDSQLSTTRVSLRVYNLAGQLVRTLVDKSLEPGVYKVFWDGLGEQGREVKSGVYFYKLTINDRSFTKKMTLLR